MEGWRRLAELIRVEAASQYDTLTELAAAAGLSKRTIEDLTAGQRTGYRESTLYRLEAALGWEHGSAMRVVGGMKPRREADPGLAVIRDAWPRLSPRDRQIVLILVDALQR